MDLEAFILIKTDAGKAGTIAKRVSNIEGVKVARSVTGPYEVIAHIEAKDLVGLGKLVTERIQGIRGVTSTITCIAVELEG